MEAMPEFVEQPLYSGNHYVAVVSGSIRNLSQYPEVFVEMFRCALHHLTRARSRSLVSIYYNLITIKRLTTRAISLIKDVEQNEISCFRVTEDLLWIHPLLLKIVIYRNIRPVSRHDRSYRIISLYHIIICSYCSTLLFENIFYLCLFCTCNAIYKREI